MGARNMQDMEHRCCEDAHSIAAELPDKLTRRVPGQAHSMQQETLQQELLTMKNRLVRPHIRCLAGLGHVRDLADLTEFAQGNFQNEQLCQQLYYLLVLYRGVAQVDLCRRSILVTAHGRPDLRSAGYGPDTDGPLKARIWAMLRFSDADFGRGTDLATPGRIRRIGSGVVRSVPQTKSAPERRNFARNRALRGPFSGPTPAERRSGRPWADTIIDFLYGDTKRTKIISAACGISVDADITTISHSARKAVATGATSESGARLTLAEERKEHGNNNACRRGPCRPFPCA